MARKAHPQTIAAIRRLHRDGWSYAALSRLCGRASDTIGRWCDPAVAERKRRRNAARNKERSFADPAARKRWRAENRGSATASRLKYKTDHPDRVKASDKKYRKDHKAELAAIQARRRAAAPPWLTEEHLNEIRSFYSAAEMMTKAFGVKYEVDHVHPTGGKSLCGLHVPWNLQILTRRENRSKGGKLLVQ